MSKSTIALAFVLVYYLVGQITDYNENVRFATCTLKTNDFEKCNARSERSPLYNLLLDTEIPRLSQCVLPGENDNALCSFFKIKRSQ